MHIQTIETEDVIHIDSYHDDTYIDRIRFNPDGLWTHKKGNIGLRVIQFKG